MRFVLAVIAAGVLFGTTATSQSLGTDGSNPISVGAARLVFGGGLLALVSWWLAKRRSPIVVGELDVSVDPAPGPVRDRRVPTWLIALAGGFGVVAYQPFFFGGAQLNGVAIGTVVALGSAPVFTGLFEGLLNKRFPGRVWAVSTTVALVGIVILVFATAQSGTGAGPLGLLVSAAAGISYAGYTIFIKLLLGRGWSSSTAVGALFGIAAIGSLPLLLLSEPNWIGTVDGWIMVAWLAVGSTVLANLLFGYGLVGLSAATVATLTLAEPLTAALLGVFVLGEQLSALALLGLGVLAAALAYLALATERPRKIVV